jgi:hypothetical protein
MVEEKLTVGVAVALSFVHLMAALPAGMAEAAFFSICCMLSSLSHRIHDGYGMDMTAWALVFGAFLPVQLRYLLTRFVFWDGLVCMNGLPSCTTRGTKCDPFFFCSNLITVIHCTHHCALLY